MFESNKLCEILNVILKNRVEYKFKTIPSEDGADFKKLYLKLKEIYEEKEEDILQVTKDTPIDTPIFVWNNGDNIKTPGYFAGLSGDNKYKIYKYGKTSYTCEMSLTSHWDNASLNANAKSILNWIPNTGNIPKCKWVMIKVEEACGEYIYTVAAPECFDWRLDLIKVSRIKEYLVLE